MARIARRTSLDAAARHAARCLIQGNAAIEERFRAAKQEVLARPSAFRARVRARLANHTVVFIPGWAYIEAGAITGADFQAQRDLLDALGVAWVLAPIDEAGSVEANAATVRRTLTALPGDGPVVLVSASSGSPAALEAIAGPGSPAFTRVEAWINLGGILHGTPLIDHYDQGLRRVVFAAFGLLQGWSTNDVRSMSAARSRARVRQSALPDHVAVTNYVGIPMTRDISERVSFFHGQLSTYGPNDGLTLVTDPILPGTDTIVALGQDHFFADDPQLDATSLALIDTALARRAP